MKTSNLSFAEGFLGTQAQVAKKQGKSMMTFDWDKASEIIKTRVKEHKDLTAEAGLEGDWDYTGGEIFADGKPTNDDYTYLSSNWATPTLILSWDGTEQEEIECFTNETERLKSYSKWDDESLKILGIELEK
tara:strand:- start:264 stop:659 length:396 start_codon:yes stop_codon:yes gene_type:complete